MDPAEVSHRAARLVGQLSQAALGQAGGAVPHPRPRGVTPPPWLAAARQPGAHPDEADILREADLAVAGRIGRLDGGEVELGSDPDWHAAIARLGLMPRGQPAAGVTRDALRVAMELHRHAHLVRLAQAWHLTREEHYHAAFQSQLSAWLVQHPVGAGVAWHSALDAGLRLLNWSMAWQLLEGRGERRAIGPELRDAWVRSVYEHVRFVRHNRSRHSSANNHLVGELVGLVAARVTWPWWLEVVRWGDAARRELHVQAQLQVHADGVGCEQASWYQAFVFELLAAFVWMERSLGHPDDERLMRRLGAMARFMAALRDHAGQISHHGDADHAMALGLTLRGECPADRMIDLADALGCGTELGQLVRRRTALRGWLDAAGPQSARAVQPADSVRARQCLPRAFEEGGYYQLGADFGTDDEVLLTADAGPLGYLGIAAHGHADALSLRLSVRGQALLVDRGTYVYNNEPRWRHYLRGTAAHNTVCLDETDQSAYGGPFLWLRKAAVRVLSFASRDAHGHLEAEHDGYQRLAGRPVHRRRVDWHGSAMRFEVLDTIDSAGSHDVRIAWHFAPGVRVQVHGRSVHASADGVRLRLRMPEPGAAFESPGGQWMLHHGDPEGLHGWHSPRFGALEPAATVVWHCRSAGRMGFRTLIEIDPSEGGQ